MVSFWIPFPRLRSIYKQGPGGWSIGAGSFLYLGTGAPEAYPGRILVDLGGFLSHPDDLLFLFKLFPSILDRSKGPQDRLRASQDGLNGAKMEPSWLPNRIPNRYPG